jgi:3-oxoadipate enol-lactonase
VLERHRGAGYRRAMAQVAVNGATLHVEEAGNGPAVLFLHGGLGDRRLWEPQAAALANRFRCIRYDLRFFGRSSGPAAPWSSVDDAIGLLDALGLERAALVRLSLGGGLALDIAAAHPDRVWAIVHVAASFTGAPANLDGDEQEAAYDEAIARGDLDAAMDIDFALWAPLGVDDTLRELWRATPDARGLPAGARPLPRTEPRLEEISAPTLVVIAAEDPAFLREHGETVARRVPGARRVVVESDHYLTLRQPEQVGELLLEFLGAAAPPA